MLTIDNLIHNEALKIFILSMLPITELRFSIPYGMNYSSLLLYQIIIISIMGNILIGSCVIYVIGPIMYYLRKIYFFKKIVDYIFQRTLKKSKSIERRKFYGLMIFVAVPLPMTGVWTGALASYLLNLNRKTSISAIVIGVLISSSIVTCLTLLSIELF